MSLRTLDEFLEHALIYAGFPRSEYVKRKGFLDLYVRVSRRLIDGELRETIDLASINARSPGRGCFKKLVADLREKHPEVVLYVECVLSDRFAEGLERMGFIRDKSTGESVCYYMLPKGVTDGEEDDHRQGRETQNRGD